MTPSDLYLCFQLDGTSTVLMHGFLLVNAELDSMGGVIDSGGGGLKTSPRRTAIENAQAELRYFP